MNLIFTEIHASLGKEIFPKNGVTNVESYIAYVFILLVGISCFISES